jgi:hypothetical protein
MAYRVIIDKWLMRNDVYRAVRAVSDSALLNKRQQPREIWRRVDVTTGLLSVCWHFRFSTEKNRSLHILFLLMPMSPFPIHPASSV